MTDIKSSSKSITQLLGDRSDTLDKAIFVAKLLTAAGAALLAMAKVNGWANAEYFAAAIVLVSTLFVLWADKKSARTLSEAREAIDLAIEQERVLEDGRRKSDAAERAYITELERLSHLQVARDLVRDIFEGVALSKTDLDEVTIIDRMLQQARRSLFLALGFQISDFYTVCVYRRVVDKAGVAELVCCAHIRAIDCDLSAARTWKEGVGAAGISLSTKREVVVPDLNADQLGSLYHLPLQKPDDSRYRAIVAEPISLNGNGDLWGVVVATSSVPDHFSLEDRSYVYVAQSLAGMISLAVKLVRSKQGH